MSTIARICIALAAILAPCSVSGQAESRSDTSHCQIGARETQERKLDMIPGAPPHLDSPGVASTTQGCFKGETLPDG